jgi:multidrug efflux pump subunit AcrB
MRTLVAALATVAMLGCRSSDPDPVAPPVIAISFSLDGADAPTIEREVVEPVEAALASLQNVRSIGARIDADHALVSAELAPGADVDRISQDVQHALGMLLPKLPRELAPPTITRTRRDDQPVLWLAVRGTLPIASLSSQATEAITPRLERVSGVAGVELHGMAELAVIIHPDLERITATGLTIVDVLAAVRMQSIDVPTGRIDSPGGSIRVAGKLADLEALGNTVVRQQGEALVRLRDVARIEVGLTRDPTGEEPAIGVKAQSTANKATVLRAVREELAAIARELPAGVKVAEIAVPPAHARRPVAPLVVAISGPELDALRDIARAIEAELAAARISQVVRDPPDGQPERIIVPDRDRAAQFGISLADLATTIHALGGTEHAGELVVEGQRRDVILRVPADSLEALLARVGIRDRQGTVIPITTIVSVTAGLRQTITRRDRQRTITLSIDAPPPLLAAARERLAERTRELHSPYRIVVSP